MLGVRREGEHEPPFWRIAHVKCETARQFAESGQHSEHLTSARLNLFLRGP